MFSLFACVCVEFTPEFESRCGYSSLFFNQFCCLRLTVLDSSFYFDSCQEKKLVFSLNHLITISRFHSFPYSNGFTQSGKFTAILTYQYRPTRLKIHSSFHHFSDNNINKLGTNHSIITMKWTAYFRNCHFHKKKSFKRVIESISYHGLLQNDGYRSIVF